MTYETTWSRVIAALVAGTAVGPPLLMLGVTVTDNPRYWPTLADAALDTLFFVPIFGFLILVWGGPFWLLFHYLRWRNWWMATVPGLAAGAFNFFGTWIGSMDPADSISAIGGVVYTHGHMTPYGWEQTSLASIALALSGVVAGLTIWKVAYRRVPA